MAFSDRHLLFIKIFNGPHKFVTKVASYGQISAEYNQPLSYHREKNHKNSVWFN